MDIELYDMIFKRKSFHLFRNVGDEKICDEELEEIKEYLNHVQVLVENIQVKIEIVKETTCQRGQEYCILFYSEKKDHYLENIGYIGEQIDLFLVSKNIGTLWFGIGKTEKKQVDGLDFVIMMAIKKVDSKDKFRKDMYKSKRKELSEIWYGKDDLKIANIVRFAPSACNTQPWIVEASQNEYDVYRYRKEGKRGIMPKDKVVYYNQIDMGIFLCFLELCMMENQIVFKRELYVEEDFEQEKNLIAKYEFE
ncbi:MAG: nitroreductase family protein [Traorella sp.]